MRAMLLTATILVLGATAALAAPITANVNERTIEAVLHLDRSTDIAAVHDLLLTVTGRRGADYDVLLSDAELAWLRANGWRVEVVGRAIPAEDRGAYRTYAEVVDELGTIAQQHPDLTQRIEFGQSADGKKMYVLKIAGDVANTGGRPAVWFDGSVHGDEAIGTAVCFGFIYELIDNYGDDSEITALLDNAEIWVAPAVNPDGLNSFRGNGNGVDLNRNFPFWYEGAGGWNGQPETKSVMSYALEVRPMLYINFHAGAELVNYNWDGIYTRSPDNDLELAMGQIYAAQSGYDVTNGADWYIADGTLEDWFHGSLGALAAIVEISLNKMPAAGAIQGYVDKNVPSMLDWAQQSQRGVHGLVTSALDGGALEALVVAKGESRLTVCSDPVDGDYHRLLPAGQHTLSFWVNGYGWTEAGAPVQNGQATEVDASIAPNSDEPVYGALRCIINLRKDASDDPANVSTPTLALGPKDDVAFSLGVGGWAVFDLGAATPIQDRDGADFRIWEKGDDESYEVFVAAQWVGPWKSAGAATGSAEFDLADTGLTEARYVKLVDNSAGANTGATPGADIDAIEAYPLCDAIAVDFSAAPLTGEAPLAVTFTASYDAPQGCIQTAAWDFGDGGTSADFQPTHTYTKTGVYTVKVTVAGPGGQDAQTRESYITVSGGDDDDQTPDDDDESPSADDDDAAADDDDDDSGGCGC